MKLDVAGCGSMVVDLFHRVPRIIGPDEKILIDGGRPQSGPIPQTAVGGVVLNHLGWARVLGLQAGVFGKLGDDRNGAFLRAGIRRLGLKHHLTRDGHASSFAAIFVDRDGNRAIYMARGATAQLRGKEIQARHGDFIQSASIVTTEISQLPLDTVIAILRIARQASIPTILDVDVPPSDACATLGTRAQLERALRLATILKPAKAAASELVGQSFSRDHLKQAKALHDRYRNDAVVITAGAEGCAIATADESLQIPAFQARQIDATGAGDAFMGGLIAGLRWNLPWPSIGRLGNAAGAVCVERLGAFPENLQLREAILRRYGAPLPIGRRVASGAGRTRLPIKPHLSAQV